MRHHNIQVSKYFSLLHTHARTHARTHTRTHAHLNIDGNRSENAVTLA